MHPSKVKRNALRQLTDLPNVGAATAGDLKRLGISEPGQLLGRDPFEMYNRLCQLTGVRHDPCVIDVFLSVTRFVEGDEPRHWWAYTAERKQALGQTAVKRRRTA